MNSSETETELQRLRAELEALKLARQQPTPSATKSAAKPARVTGADSLRWNPDEINEQLSKIAKLIKDEVAERPPMAFLVVFVLGLLRGRLMH